jgi:hypothetical protein
MVTWTMEEDEAQTVLDILDMWIDGHDEATDNVVIEGTWATTSELLDAIDDMQRQKRHARDARDNLFRSMGSRAS